ncbi:haloacid dehalogenase type II [Polynucleobacter sp. MWH-Adler-W8]|uniref:haloacid dehalogenase type II n=1 Tax=Polynucleobacter sp. MWH-Adler-W8 TaxID=1819727 RepID=UPI0009F931A1|nr:haloacid dehalogenase type II [Polynucleobacter sp. MWH-Adler-W8]
MDPKILAFDVFGTVVDWHGSIAAEAKRLSLPVDPNEFAAAWRNGYKPAMAKVRSGTLPWTKIDDLHRMILDDILKTFNITSLSESQIHEFNLVWHRLNPWLDTVEGLTRLKGKFTIVTLSNGNLGLLADMAKNAGLPWDLILSAEVFRHYKPDPETYLGVAEIFNVLPEQVMLVAAHKDDLLSANACGLQTAFIERPLEFGPNFSRQDLHREEFTTYHAEDLMDLATQLNC